MTLNEQSDDREFLRLLFDTIIPFNRFLGVRSVEIGNGIAILELPFRPEFIGNPVTRALHGGVISALMDPCGGLAVWSQIGLEDLVATVDLRIDYLRPAVGEENLQAKGSVIRLGNRVGVVELRAYFPGREDHPVAVGTGVYNVKRTEEASSISLREMVQKLQKSIYIDLRSAIF
jgi:uncharacterized protein (TIGR00369 family)